MPFMGFYSMGAILEVVLSVLDLSYLDRLNRLSTSQHLLVFLDLLFLVSFGGHIHNGADIYSSSFNCYWYTHISL